MLQRHVAESIRNYVIAVNIANQEGRVIAFIDLSDI
jgi:hypothetical protein